jgi:DNA-binding NtrC family response regulator
VDNRLPDGRGIDLCRAISAQQPAMTLILHTGMISQLE